MSTTGGARAAPPGAAAAPTRAPAACHCAGGALSAATSSSESPSGNVNWRRRGLVCRNEAAAAPSRHALGASACRGPGAGHRWRGPGHWHSPPGAGRRPRRGRMRGPGPAGAGLSGPRREPEGATVLTETGSAGYLPLRAISAHWHARPGSALGCAHAGPGSRGGRSVHLRFKSRIRSSVDRQSASRRPAPAPARRC